MNTGPYPLPEPSDELFRHFDYEGGVVYYGKLM
jgi:hypothetical protein